MPLGTEVKAIREGRVNLRDSFARLENGGCFSNVNISPYSHRGYAHTSRRAGENSAAPREIASSQARRLRRARSCRYACILKDGRVKVAVSLAKGKKEYDKRETIKRREADRETRRGEVQDRNSPMR